MVLRIAASRAARARAVHSAPSGCVGKKLQTDSDIAQPAMSRRLETGPTNITSDSNISLLRDLPKREGKRPICFHTLIVYFNLDLVTGLEIAVDCFVTVSLEQLVPRADHMDPVLAYNNLRWHSLDRRGRNHLSDGLHRKLDLVSSTHYGKAKAEDGHC
jgi:hypothetical protein